MMTDPPTDDTEAREPDAPDPTDAKHHAPRTSLHGHTGGFSVQSRPPVRFAPPRPNALGRRGILRFYKFFSLHADSRPIQSLGGFPRPTATQTFPSSQ
eukprot:scaffold8013_cov124-Isochrysis_galbana.AAC.16